MKKINCLKKAFLSISLLTLLPVVGMAAWADSKNYSSYARTQKDVTKKARAEDPASSYTLTGSGYFYQINDGYKRLVESNVEDFKISQHPEDVAVVYFIRSGDLWYVNQSGTARRLCSNVKKIHGKYKYNVVPSIHTKIVNTVLTKDGRFIAWDNKNKVYEQRSVRDYCMNGCFGTGRPFSTYVCFLIDGQGYVTKVKGKDVKNSKADHSRQYENLKHFTASNDIK